MTPTLDQLMAMPDEELSALAAKKVLGWKEIPSASEPHSLPICWDTPAGEMRKVAFRPATDRNQSGELLKKCVERGAKFAIWVGHVPPTIDILTGRSGHDEVPGVDACAETMAAILAAQALEAK